MERPNFAGRPVWWTVGQLLVMAVEAIVLVGCFAMLLLTRYNYVSVLWTHPVGVRMLIIAGLLTIGNFLSFLGITWLLNRLLPPGPDAGVARVLVHLVVGIILFLLLYVPVLFILFTGPAAILIQDNLLVEP